MQDRTSTQPFGVAVRELMVVNPVLTHTSGKPDWKRLSVLSAVGYETLRKAVTGERSPAEPVMVAVAKALKVKASYFLEYRLMQARNAFDPKIVGVDEALQNLDLLHSRRLADDAPL
jgi:hypothetical protein